MPKYVYYCEVCDDMFEVFHGMKEKHGICDLCGKRDFIYRIPQKTSVLKKTTDGQKTKEGIEENREILKEMKKQAKDTFYE